jgi:mesencephalic astrocyte-derived neurotrophic factor
MCVTCHVFGCSRIFHSSSPSGDTMILNLSSFFLFFYLIFQSNYSQILSAKKDSTKKVDPRECEVCIANLEEIDKLLVTSEQKKDKLAVREAIGKRCTKSGFGSEWKPNPELSQKDVKMCYIFEPIKEAITVPFITGMPKEKICKRLKKDNPDICDVKYRKPPPFPHFPFPLIISRTLPALKVEKKDGEKVNYNKLRVKELKEILNQRGVKCSGCTEKTEFVKKCEETEHLDI